MCIPRCEHPKPQFFRNEWLNLNGQWEFEIDNGKSGIERGLLKNDTKLNSEITVPFCPQSKLSGLEHKDFMYRVWYKKTITLTKEQLSKKINLHIGAADYETHVFVNEKEVGSHIGGYVSFKVDITSAVVEGKNVIAIYCDDDERDRHIPRGKQSEEYYSHGCDYTRTTGIWQTVWLEFINKTSYIERVKYYPNVEDCSLTVEALLCGKETFKLTAYFDGKKVGYKEVNSNGGLNTVTINLDEKHLWDIGEGNLYDLVLEYGQDKVNSYFGLRSIRFEGMKWLLNEKSRFQRLVLDQGFYPDGVYTAPTDADLERDIDLSMAAGFNGARLHQKVFEERFLYYCDKKGYIVWGEYGDWGLDHSYLDNIYSILPEWTEEVNRDFNHPAIIGWCPRNETWDIHGRRCCPESTQLLYRMTKALDPTRPCIDTSGNFHVETDIFDVHDYEPNPEVYKAHYDKLVDENVLVDRFYQRQTWRGEPVMISEYGGIGWSIDGNSWGYGKAPKNEEEYIERFQGLTSVIMNNPKIFGLCYTQLTDVEQECNGIYSFNREERVDVNNFREVLTKKAAIED